MLHEAMRRCWASNTRQVGTRSVSLNPGSASGHIRWAAHYLRNPVRLALTEIKIHLPSSQSRLFIRHAMFSAPTQEGRDRGSYTRGRGTGRGFDRGRGRGTFPRYIRPHVKDLA